MYDEINGVYFSERNGKLFFYSEKFKITQIEYLWWKKNMKAFSQMKEDFSIDPRRLNAHPFKKFPWMWTAYLFWWDRLIYIPLNYGVFYLFSIIPNHEYDKFEKHVRFTKNDFTTLQEVWNELLLKYLLKK